MGAVAADQSPKIVKLKCSVKNYDWGKVGNQSGVARVYANNSGEAVDSEQRYAEFWMGSHDSGPSYVVVEDFELVSLKDWIKRNPYVLGDKVIKIWGANLPFLFKVLSVEKALSIQAHPDKQLAEVLHKQRPEVYKDGNHKPEMALAQSDFEALCGFVSLEELKYVIQNVPEIIELVGTECAEQVLQIDDQSEETKQNEVLQSLFTKLMTVDKVETAEAISKLISRLHLKREVRDLTDKEELVLRLEKQYPGDIGVIAAFLLNYVKLNSGEAIYLGEDEPHAYIHGECIECMATSDNVVRAGLTPKERDVHTLCSMLTYKQGCPEILTGIPANPYTVKYLPPFDEFEVDRCILPEETSTVFPAIPGPSIFVVMAGEGKMCLQYSEETVGEGDVLFTPANAEVTVETAVGLNLYRAGVNSRFLEQ